MTGIQCILVIVIFIVNTNECSAQYRSKRSMNEYILRKCTATAELIRNYKNEDLGSTSGVNRNLSHILNTSQQDLGFHTKNKINIVQSDNVRSNVQRERISLTTLYDIAQTRRAIEKNREDTPLKTVNIEGIEENKPLIFRRKNPLPELERNISGRKIEMSGNVIVIKPAGDT